MQNSLCGFEEWIGEIFFVCSKGGAIKFDEALFHAIYCAAIGNPDAPFKQFTATLGPATPVELIHLLQHTTGHKGKWFFFKRSEGRRSEQGTQRRSEGRSEGTKEEAKEEVKEQVKEESKEESKEEVKEEVKQEVKEEPKEGAVKSE